jgi:hypothetical protein
VLVSFGGHSRFDEVQPKILYRSTLESSLMPAGGPNQRVVMSSRSSGKREFIVATGLALMLGVLLSFIAVYGLSRYFGSVDEIQTTGSVHHTWTN